jgi:hypothetical protein
MAKYTIVIQRTQTHTCEITLSALDDDKANEKAQEKIDTDGWADKQDWTLESDDLEITEVNED